MMAATNTRKLSMVRYVSCLSLTIRSTGPPVRCQLVTLGTRADCCPPPLVHFTEVLTTAVMNLTQLWYC